jgi:two-component system copper resistance phosphate regulon response regulator CusR
MPKILLVEDELAIADLVLDCLQAADYMVDHLPDGAEAINRLKYSDYDLIILDWNLPGLSGIDICRQYRSKGGGSLILMLTSRREIDDKEAGFDAGADDYLTKPFHARELTARVRALLKRSTTTSSNQLTAGDVMLQVDTHQVFVGGREVQLMPKEFALLEFFLRYPNRVFSADAIIDRVWSTDTESNPSVVRTYVNRLRAKLDVDGKESVIATVHGVGYRFIPRE